MSPSRPYVVDDAALRPGDVLLSAQPAAASLVVRLFTFSRYSHAAIALGNGMYAEAVGLGVRLRSTGLLVAPRLVVRRLRREDASAARRAAEIARGYAHAGYWLSGAMLTVFRRTPFEARHRLFCSQLVATAYEEADARLVDIAAEKVTPARLARCDRLVTVPGAAYVPAHLPEFLVGHVDTLSDREALLMQGVYADVAPWFETRGREVPRSVPHMLAALAELESHDLVRSLDAAIREAMVRHRYASLATLALRECVVPMREEVARVAATDWPREVALQQYVVYQRTHATMEEQAAIGHENAQVYRGEFERTGIPAFETFAENAQTHAAIAEEMRDLSAAMLHALNDRYGLVG